MRLNKIQTEVKVSPELKVQAIQDKTPRTFSLYGVVIHQGSSLGSGHYFALVKKHGNWFEANDSQVISRTEVQALEESTKNGYLFFYREETQ